MSISALEAQGKGKMAEPEEILEAQSPIAGWRTATVAVTVVAAVVGGPLEEVMEVMQLLQPAVPVAEEIATSEELPADEQYDRGEVQRMLAKAIGELPERLRILLEAGTAGSDRQAPLRRVK